MKSACGCRKPLGPLFPSVCGPFDGDPVRELRCCQRCKGYVGYAPARDTPETAVEVRAAAQSLVPAGTYCNADIWSGYFCAMNDIDPPPWPHCPDAWAGWLAHEITEHEDGPRHLAGCLARVIAEHPTGADQ